MTNILDSVIAAAERNAAISESDYIREGLLHCGLCNTPKQCKIALVDIERVVHSLCKCQSEKRDADRAAQERRDEADRIQRLKTQGIQDRAIHNWTFSNDDGSNPTMTDKAMRYYTKWAQMYADNIGILLWGGIGTGKTYTAACIANALLENGVPVLMTSFPKIINALSGFAVGNRNEYIESFNRYKLLVLDDLGTERQSEFAQEIVYSVIDTRYKNHQPLIVTTNLTLDDLKNPPNITCGRIYDRILEMCVPIHFSGDSRRKAAYQNKIAQARSIFED